MTLQKKFFIISIATAGAALLAGAAWTFALPPALKALGPKTANAELSSTVAFHFSKPLNRNALSPSIEPYADGTWVFEDPLVQRHFFRTVRFIPNVSLMPETTYMVELAGVQSTVSFAGPKTVSHSFMTRALPDVTVVTPEDGTSGISPLVDLSISLDGPNPGTADFAVQLAPEAQVTLAFNGERDGYFGFLEEPLPQGADITVRVLRTPLIRDLRTHEVVQRGEEEEVYRGTFSVAPPPAVESVSPSGTHTAVDEPLVIVFSDAMDADSLKQGFSIEPKVAGELSFSEDGRTLTFAPDAPLAYDTAYTVTVPAGTANAIGGFLEEDAAYSFTTIGPVRVSNFSPGDGASGVSVNSGMEIVFDQEVDHASAESKIIRDPAVNGTFSWEGNAVRFTPSAPLAYSTTYRITVQSGVESVRGQPSSAEHAFAFTTAPETFLLNVAVDLQDRPLSCEAAALKMALAAKGIFVSENDIMAKVGYDPTPHAGDTWGDPYVAYVGNIDGKQNTTGYGVYWDPIAKAGSAWRPSEAFTGWTTAQVLQEVQQGNAVVAWGVYGNGYEDSWTTPGGKFIYAWKGEHARTVVGFTGTPENPSRIILNDPYAGRITWTRQQFERDFGIFGNAGVVVR